MNTLHEGRLPVTMKSLLALAVTAVILLTGAVPAQAAPSISCSTDGRTYGWVTSPVADHKVGARYCKTMVLGNLNGEYAHWFKSAAGPWIPTSNNAPYMGGAPGTAGRAHGDAARAMAASYGMKLHFVKYSGTGDRVGYLRSDGAVLLRGTYYPSPQHPGHGLIEISAGGGPLGLADRAHGAAFMRTMILDTTRHEIAHGKIEGMCDTWNPASADGRIENITDAYAVLFVGMSRDQDDMTYGYTAADVAKARAYKAGNCG